MRLVFAGTPDAAVPSLRALAASDHDVVAVVTRPDAPVGRRRVLTASPMAQAAAELDLDTLKTARLDAAVTAEIAALQPDLGVVVAYGGLVREPLLSMPPHGWINLHFSLLPRWRGAAPVQHAIIAGDSVTGASVFRLVPELDAGDVYDELTYPVPATATSGDVLDALAHRGAVLLSGVVDAIGNGTAAARAQTGTPTLAPKLSVEDGQLSWHEPADAVLARFRGVTPEPGAYTTVGGKRVKVLVMQRAERDIALAPGRMGASGREVLVGTATDPLAVVQVQPAGKASMPAGDWWRGLRVAEPVAGR